MADLNDYFDVRAEQGAFFGVDEVTGQIIGQVSDANLVEESPWAQTLVEAGEIATGGWVTYLDKCLEELFDESGILEALWPAVRTVLAEAAFYAGVYHGILETALEMVKDTLKLICDLVLAAIYQENGSEALSLIMENINRANEVLTDEDSTFLERMAAGQVLRSSVQTLGFYTLFSFFTGEARDIAIVLLGEDRLKEADENCRAMIEGIHALLNASQRDLEDLFGETVDLTYEQAKAKIAKANSLRFSEKPEDRYESGRLIGEMLFAVASVVLGAGAALRTATSLPARLQGAVQSLKLQKGGGGGVVGGGVAATQRVTDGQPAAKGENGTPNEPGGNSGTPESAESPESPNGTSACRAGVTQTAGCPVSVTSGEELLQYVDASLPGPLPLAWTRMYRSGNDVDAGLGHGWTFSYGERLEETSSGVDYYDEEGRVVPFVKVPTGESSRHRLEGLTLTRESSARLRLVSSDGRIRIFAAPGPRKRLIEVRDRNGNRAELRYDPSGALKEILRAHSEGVSVSRDGNGRIDALYRCDANGERRGEPLVRYRYDAAGDLTGALDALGHGEQFAYRNHLVMRRTLASGFCFKYEWSGDDKFARCTRTYGERGIYDVRFKYDPERRITETIDGRGAKTIYHYDATARVTREVDPEGGVTLTTYTKAGKPSSVTDPNGATTRYFYDDRDRLTRVVDATGAAHELRHDAADNPVRLTDPSGAAWGRHYDSKGNLVLSADANGSETRYVYDVRGLPTAITDALGHTRRLEWNRAGQLRWVRDARGLETVYSYDAEGLIESAKTGEGEPTRYTYDRAGRLLTVTDAAGNTIWLAYDEVGNLVRHVDAAGRKTEYRYEGLSQVTERIDPDGTRFRYEYDAERNLTALVNQNGERYELDYDANERLIREVGFDGREQRYGYDRAGHLARHEDAVGLDGQPRFTTFKRDPQGRLLEKTLSDGHTATFAYDAKGQLSRADNEARQLRFAYDACGRLSEEHQDEQGHCAQLRRPRETSRHDPARRRARRVRLRRRGRLRAP